MKHGSLCTGYGGLDMAAQVVFGGELAWWSDNEPGPVKVMQHHTDAPNLGDLKRIDWSAVEPVDILTAGYPCQPFSNAGKRKGADDPRHLWPWIAYGINRLRPRVVVLENVGSHLKRGFRVVAADLAALGYRVGWTLLRASDVGAAHRRERLFIIATDTAREHDDWAGDVRPGRRAEHPDGGGQTGELTLFPTPRASDGEKGGPNQRGSSGDPMLPNVVHKLTLLPTPSAVSYGNNRGGAAGRVGKVRPSLEGIVKILVPEGMGWQGWQEYEPAIRRWESVLDRAAPYPATRGPKGGVKVAPAFGEWLMGLPEGHIADVPDLSINEQLKLVGNGVVPQQAEHAIRDLCGRLHSIALYPEKVSAGQDIRSLFQKDSKRGSMTTDTSSFFGEQQSSDVPRDQWGRYRLPDADGTETGWTRATTFAATLAEQYGLSIWHQRQVVWGLARRTDLIELAATVAGPEDKKALGSIVDEAHIAAGTEAKANRGTALHKASEIGDRAGGQIGAVPPQFQQDYWAYRTKIIGAGIEILPEWIERVVITPDYHVAGTPDRLVRCAWDGKIRVLDLKTGNLDYAQLEWSVQLALYAHARAARNYATNTYEQLPEIADDYAIVAHIRPESGICELYRVDIRMGWAFARLCAEVRDAREHKALLTPLVVEPGNAFAGTRWPQNAEGAPSIAQRATAAVAAVEATSDTASFWSAMEAEETDDGLSYNGVPLAEYGKPAEDPKVYAAPPDPSEVPDEQSIADQVEEIAQELSKRPKAQLQQIARDLMAQVSGASIKLTQHRIKIAREIVATAVKYGVEIPSVKGTGAHNAKPVEQPDAPKTEVDSSAADRVSEGREKQWRATMFDEIRAALTVDKLQVLRSQAGPKWDDAMTEAARLRVESLDAQHAATTPLTPAQMIEGATSRETLSKAWEVATNRGSNLDGWTAELDAAATAKLSAL